MPYLQPEFEPASALPERPTEAPSSTGAAGPSVSAEDDDSIGMPPLEAQPLPVAHSDSEEPPKDLL